MKTFEVWLEQDNPGSWCRRTREFGQDVWNAAVETCIENVTKTQTPNYDDLVNILKRSLTDR